MKSRYSRREFIHTSSMAGLGLALAPGLIGMGKSPKAQVRLGFIGVGLRGCNHLHNVLSRQDVIVPAICDIDPERLSIASDMIVKSGREKPELYTGNEHAFEKLLQRSDIDGKSDGERGHHVLYDHGNLGLDDRKYDVLRDCLCAKLHLRNRTEQT